MPTVSQSGISRINTWVMNQRRLRTTNPLHRVLVDVDMESVSTPSAARLVEKAYGSESRRLLGSIEGLRGIDMRRIEEQIKAGQDMPVGGAGGLGIISETINWTGARYGDSLGFGLFNVSPMHTMIRTQTFEGNRQSVKFYEISPEGKEGYHYLGSPVSIDIFKDGQLDQLPVDAWLFDGFSCGDDFVPSIKLSVPGITGELYPQCESPEIFAQMHVLGQGGFRIAQHFGLLGKEDAIADLVVGHDGHSALFKFNIFLWFYAQHKNVDAALQATRKLCVATIHAPQNGTIPRTSGDMVQKFYTAEAERLWGLFGEDYGKKSNSLFVEMRLAKATGGVSPVHLMVTRAEETASKRAFANDALKLLPENVNPDSLRTYPDTIDVESWIGIGTKHVLDSFVGDWQKTPEFLGDPSYIDDMVADRPFREELAKAFSVQDHQFLDLLTNCFPRKFGVNIPENAIVFASLRRATKYKIGLLIKFLEHYETIEEISKKIGRPIFYLFGGVAHKDDSPSIDALSNLLDMIEKINSRPGAFNADFLVDYDYQKAKWIFPGLAMRGAWIGATDPFAFRSQGTEAFGPSYLKAAMNGAYIMGSDDGGAGCLRNYPTVHIYGPSTFAGGRSFHNDVWNNRAIVELSQFLLASGFIRVFEKVSTQIAADLDRYDAGRGAYAPGMDPKIRTMLQTIAGYNGRVLMESYLKETGR